MPTEDFETLVASSKPILLGELMRKYSFHVPPNQRPYSWGKDHWLDLWGDLLDTQKELPRRQNNPFYNYHFFGPMFFVTSTNTGEEDFRILDGQQRIATTGILLTVIFDLLDLIRENGRISTEGSIVLGEINECLFIKEKNNYLLRILLGKNNKTFYEKLLKTRRLMEEDSFVNPITKISFLKNESRHNKSNAEILTCYKFFLDKIIFHLADQQNFTINNRQQLTPEIIISIVTGDRSEKFLIRLFESISERLYVLKIIVPSSDIMYEMFETLNQRGEKLLVTDLFKNLIFDFFENELNPEQTQNLWDELLSICGDELDEFLRHFWLYKFEFVRQKKLFRLIKSVLETKNAGDFERFMRELIDNARIYFALRNASDPLWINQDEISQIIGELDYLGFRQGLPLLLACYNLGDIRKFKELLKSYRNLCVLAYTILGGNPNEFEEDYSKWARQLKNTETSIDQIVSILKSNTPSDEEEIRSKIIGMKGVSTSIARYIITKINDALVTSPLNRAWGNKPTVEHVIPQKPETWWNNFLREKRMRHKDLINRLGNLTILSESENKELGNISYIEKRRKYLSMGLPINSVTFDGQQFNEFDGEAIKAREQTFVDLIIKHKIWS